MIEFINNVLSYDFIPEIWSFFKLIALSTTIAFIVFLMIAFISYVLDNNPCTKIINYIASAIGIIFILGLTLSMVVIVSIPLLFTIVSIKNGFIDILHMSELAAGLISAFVCILLFSIIVDILVFRE